MRPFPVVDRPCAQRLEAVLPVEPVALDGGYDQRRGIGGVGFFGHGLEQLTADAFPLMVGVDHEMHHFYIRRIRRKPLLTCTQRISKHLPK